MKLSTNTNQYTTTITKAADFGIQESDMSHIMGILRSQIYSDKPLAVIREYSTNAVDANIEAGVTDPIHVNLPTMADPVLSIRDYGKGLTDEQVCQLYVKYGSSTKRDSNDYTGCLGIGCKAGFAYGDSFQVISYTKMYITTWLARIDESQRGTISLINQQLNKPNVRTGVEIKVNVKKQDIDQFNNTAETFFKYWPQQPTCNRELPTVEVQEATDDWQIAQDLDANSYSYRTTNSNASVLMGNILYPINTSMLSSHTDSTNLLYAKSVILKAPLGALDIAANREGLEYTQRTLDSLVAMANNMFIDLVSTLTKKVANQPTRLSASIAAHTYDALPHTISNSLRQSCTWQGMPLLNNISFNTNVIAHSMQKSWRNDTWRNKKDEASSVSLHKNTKLCVVSDHIPLANATRRVRSLQFESINPNEETYYVILRTQLSSIDPKLTVDDYVDLDTIQPLKAKRTASTITNSKTKKAVKINVCFLSPHNLKSARLSKEAQPIANDNGKYIYVPLDRFDWCDKPLHWLDNLRDIQTAMYAMGDKESRIHGVKKHHVKNLDDSWITLDNYMASLYKQYKVSNKDATDYELASGTVDYQAPNLDEQVFEIIHKMENEFSHTCYIAYMYHRKDQSPKFLIPQIMRMLNIIPESTWLQEMMINLVKTYPLLAKINFTSWSRPTDEEKQALIKYIKFCRS